TGLTKGRIGVPAEGAPPVPAHDAALVPAIRSEQASLIQSEREIFRCSHTLSIRVARVSSIDIEYRTIPVLFAGALYQGFAFLVHQCLSERENPAIMRYRY